jgi:hypothetical protein
MRETKPLLFKPIGVTAESPEELVFKLSNDILYYGQIVDGVTAKPIPGALVMKGELNPTKYWGDFSIITPEQWQAIHRLGANPPLDDKALEPLREACKLEKIVRTDQQGWFEISGPATGRRSEVIAVEEDYIGCVCWSNSRLSNRSYAKPDANGLVEIPRTKLFPTATIVFEPHIEEEDDTADVRVHWFVGSENKSAWAADLTSSRLVRNYGFRPNTLQTMHVPAGLDIQVVVFLTSNKFGNAYWGRMILPKTKNLTKGQMVDLGRLTFEPAKPTFPIYLKVVNSKGQPVEGVGVWRVLNGQRWGHSHITNEFGIATFKVPLHCKGEFHVGFDEDGLKLKESIPFQIGGEEDAGREFTMTISDEMLYQLFK